MTKKLTIYQIAVIGVMAAVMCILGPLSIPVGPVPISFTNLAVFITLYVLGTKKGTISYLIYLLIGIVGVPVFSGYTSGPAKLLGPTGGYLIGFIFMAIIAGLFIDYFIERPVMCLLGMILSTIVVYIFGTAWLAYEAQMTFYAALAAGVLPFIIGDLIKILIAMFIGPKIRTALQKAHLYE